MKTKKIKIHVAIDAKGRWASAGWHSCSLVDGPRQFALDSLNSEEPYAIHEVEVDVPIPEKGKKLKGKIVKSSGVVSQ